jgi:hypothetical protein
MIYSAPPVTEDIATIAPGPIYAPWRPGPPRHFCSISLVHLCPLGGHVSQGHNFTLKSPGSVCAPLVVKVVGGNVIVLQGYHRSARLANSLSQGSTGDDPIAAAVGVPPALRAATEVTNCSHTSVGDLPVVSSESSIVAIIGVARSIQLLM